MGPVSQGQKFGLVRHCRLNLILTTTPKPCVYAITDLKGNDQGVLNVYIAPCSEKGRPLGEEHYVDEPTELLGSPYHFKVCAVFIRPDISQLHLSTLFS